MKGFLADTNVISEVRKKRRADPGVLRWYEATPEQEIFLSVITIGEIQKGISRLARRDTRQAAVFTEWLRLIQNNFTEEKRLLSVMLTEAHAWGRLQAIRPLPLLDAYLAATAVTHDLTLVTRNVRDFAGLGISLLNPFARPPEPPTPKAPPSRTRLLDHIDLRVRSLAEARGFYEGLLPALGFTMLMNVAEWLQFTAPPMGGVPGSFFGITESPSHVPNENRIAFWVESRTRVEELTALIRTVGAWEIEGPLWEDDGYYATFFADPSGNRLEFCCRDK